MVRLDELSFSSLWISFCYLKNLLWIYITLEISFNFVWQILLIEKCNYLKGYIWPYKFYFFYSYKQYFVFILTFLVELGHTSFKLSIINRSRELINLTYVVKVELHSSENKKWTHQKIKLLEYILIKLNYIKIKWIGNNRIKEVI